MTKNQIQNLINFCFHFHKNYGFSIKGISDFKYTKEKWDMYIGLNITQTEKILNFIKIINSKPMHLWHISDMLEVFKHNIGDPERINNTLYNGLHYCIRVEVKKWLNKKNNLRDYNLILILN